MNRHYKWIITFLSLIILSNNTQASCVRTSELTVRGSTDMGNIVVSPNLTVGAIIAQQTFTITGNAKTMLSCTGGDSMNADVILGSASGSDATVFSTNIAGVGIRFNRNGKDYPFAQAASKSNSLGDSTITVTLIKTATFVESGPLTAGTYTQFGYRGLNNPIMETFMNANGTTIISPSCAISNSGTQTVYLDPISRNQLTGPIGQTAGDTPFSIDLLCNGGSTINSGFDNINLTFSGEIPKGLNTSLGVLANSNTTGAKGIGIQVIETTSKKPLAFDKPYLFGSLASSQTGYTVSQKYIARYYRYGTQISAGNVEAKMLFNITYN